MRLTTLSLSILLLLSACNHSNNDIEEETVKDTEEIEQEHESNKKEKVNSKEQQLIEELPEDANIQDWNLILVNPWVALPEGFDPELVEVDNEQQIDQRIENDWYAWKEAAKEEGYQLFFASGYRSIDRQENNFNNKIQEYLDEDMTEEQAREKAKEYLTEPGHSEHHTGLALDIVDDEWIVEGNGLEPEYDQQPSQQWLIKTMADYGFILRYPKEKEDITGILYESWHFRYVGKENAQYMKEHNLALEEYIDLLKMRDKLKD